MNCKIGIIAASLLVCSLAGPAWAELSEPAAAGEETAGYPLSSPENGGGQAGINSFLDRFAGIGYSGPSSKESYNPSLAIVPPISETTLFSAFTMTGSPMNAYYSRSGTDNVNTIAAISRSAAFVTALTGDRFVLPEAGLTAFVQGYFVGSGAVASAADVAPIQTAASDPGVVQVNNINSQQSVPLPLPFLLTVSGLSALLALRKRAGNNG